MWNTRTNYFSWYLMVAREKEKRKHLMHPFSTSPNKCSSLLVSLSLLLAISPFSLFLTCLFLHSATIFAQIAFYVREGKKQVIHSPMHWAIVDQVSLAPYKVDQRPKQRSLVVDPSASETPLSSQQISSDTASQKSEPVDFIYICIPTVTLVSAIKSLWLMNFSASLPLLLKEVKITLADCSLSLGFNY